MLHFIALLLVSFTGVIASATPLSLPSQQAINRWSGALEVVNPETPSEYLKITTEGTSVPSYISWELETPINMQAAFVEAYIHISSMNAWRGLELRLSDSTSNESYIAIPILKYSDPLFNWLHEGVWQKITLSLGEARFVGNPQMDKIKYVSWYINDNGEAPTVEPLTVLLSGVRIVPAQQEPLLSITFDDGYIDTMAAAQIMSAYNLRGTAYIMPNAFGRAEHVSEADVQQLYTKYRWGISAHYEVAFTDFSPGNLANVIESIENYLIQNGYGFSAPHLAYPLGRTNTDVVLPLVKQYFRTARIASGGGETLPPADWARLRTINITPDVTPEFIRERIQKAQMHNEWIILMFHYLDDGVPENDLHYNKEEFRKMMQVISESGIKTLPVHEVWEIHRVD